MRQRGPHLAQPAGRALPPRGEGDSRGAELAEGSVVETLQTEIAGIVHELGEDVEGFRPAQVSQGLRRKLLTFVVVGGGYTGIELVTEWHDLLFGYVAKRYRGIRADEIRLSPLP